MVNHPLSDSLFRDHESLAMATSSSKVGTIAFGPNAGQKVTRIGSGFGYYEEIPLAKGHRCCSINGFSLHANTSTNTLTRDSLRKLVGKSTQFLIYSASLRSCFNLQHLTLFAAFCCVLKRNNAAVACFSDLLESFSAFRLVYLMC